MYIPAWWRVFVNVKGEGVAINSRQRRSRASGDLDGASECWERVNIRRRWMICMFCLQRYYRV